MAHVSGPTSSMPNSRHCVPSDCKCDTHEDRFAVARIQGETDAMGAEYIDMCSECLAEHVENVEESSLGCCDWCGNEASLRQHRDLDEGSSGRLYMVCGQCIRRENEEAAAELAENEDCFSLLDDDDDFY